MQTWKLVAAIAVGLLLAGAAQSQTNAPPAHAPQANGPQPAQTPAVSPTPGANPPQPAGAAVPGPTPPPAAKGEFGGLATCAGEPPTPLPAANFKYRVVIDEQTPWRPALGEVKFAVKGAGFAPADVDIVACMRWRGLPGVWVPSPALRLIDSPDTTTSTFAAIVPAKLKDQPSHHLLTRIQAKTPEDSSALGIVPLADFRIIAKTRDGSAWSYIDVTQPVGITTTTFAALFSAILVIVAWIVLYTFGRLRHVPGSHSAVLQIISTKAGYASLSQLQMILWTFVIGWAAAYVMVLSGSLIDLSTGTLVLLGISGASTLGAKLQGQTDATISPPPPDRPKPVQALTAHPIESTEMRLAWLEADTGTTDSYQVAYKETAVTGTIWTVAADAYAGTAIRIVGLKPTTNYTFQVTPKNLTGVGDAVTTDADTGAAAVAPVLGAVAGFGPSAKVENTCAEVQWTPVAGANAYRVQYRHRESDEDWKDAPSGATSTTARRLDANTPYDFRIAASPTAAVMHLGPWTYAVVTTAGPRAPVWSDLVIGLDNKQEIDVSRVQMLFFTVIVAIFVVLRVISSNSIPAIPDSFLVLMGISNGVYLSSKFIRN